MAKRDSAKADLKILFDGDCPICSREIAWLDGKIAAGTTEFINLAQISANQSVQGINRSELLRRIHAFRSDGRVLTGMEVLRELYRRAGLGWLLRPTGWPVLRVFFDGLYEAFAANRSMIGKLFERFARSGPRRRSGLWES